MILKTPQPMENMKMSEATRSIALAEAVKFDAPHQGSDATRIVAIATIFNAFIEGADVSVAEAAIPTVETVKPVAAKPKTVTAPKKPAISEEELVAKSIARIAATEAAQEAEEEAAKDAADKAESVSRDAVALAVESMLKANKRKEAVALLKKFGATSVSTVKAADYAAFIEESEAVLMSV
jgi:hypothetical protein